MQFCSRHSKDLDGAFASLSLNEDQLSSSDTARNHPARSAVPPDARPFLASTQGLIAPPARQATDVPAPPPSAELSVILLALRKLREGLLASSASAPSPVFSQRVHVFNIRAAILAFHPPGYHPSLLHLLFVLHTPDHPLPRSELVEMTTYLILDMATRQNDLHRAYTLRYKSRVKFGFQNRVVDSILKSVVMGDWVTFWRVRQKVDGYVRAILSWHLEAQRKMVLKTIGRAYYTCDINWILQSTTGGEFSWDELVQAEDVGWVRENDRAMIRKPKSKVAS